MIVISRRQSLFRIQLFTNIAMQPIEESNFDNRKSQFNPTSHEHPNKMHEVPVPISVFSIEQKTPFLI